MIQTTFICHSKIRRLSGLKRFTPLVLIICLVFLCFHGLISSIAWKFNVLLFNSSLGQGIQDNDFGYLYWNKTRDRLRWQQTSLYEIFDKHKGRAKESCLNVCTEKDGIGCTATNISQWKQMMISSTFKFMPLLSEFQYIYPFEVDYLSQPALTDIKTLPDLNLSKFYMYDAVGDKVSCGVGDVIKGHVDLVDGYGKQRTLGGDDVRVWIVDEGTQKFKAIGNVTDMRNGSYHISVKCLWPGKTKLKIEVSYPREYLRVVIQLAVQGVTRLMPFKFKKGDAQETDSQITYEEAKTVTKVHYQEQWKILHLKFKAEDGYFQLSRSKQVTVGSATPNVPGRPCLCNFTSVNQQSLYAGRPLDPRLSCEDWIESYTLPLPIPHSVTPAEYDLIQKIPREVSQRRINHNIVIVVSNTGRLPKVKPCSETNPSVTWTTNQPSGYWLPGNKWVSFSCERPNMTSEWTTSCLRNTSLLIFGDSNGARLYDIICAKVISKFTSLSVWPLGQVKTNYSNGINVTFIPLEYPLFLSQYWMSRFRYKGVATQIDNIPSTGKHVVLVHNYLHISHFHLSTTVPRLTALRDAIQRLLNRNPNVLVGIRGPHISSVEFDNNHAIGGDNLGVYFATMIRDIFADLKDKVVFLDGWEMTVALENRWRHPINRVPLEMLNTLLAFKCS